MVSLGSRPCKITCDAKAYYDRVNSILYTVSMKKFIYLIGREGFSFTQYLVSFGRRYIESIHHEMQIRGQRAHTCHLCFLGA